MIKEKLFNFLFVLFIGVMITYVNYNPPVIIYKHKNITKINDIEYVDDNMLETQDEILLNNSGKAEIVDELYQNQSFSTNEPENYYLI